jgi:toxin secretion/phage lysis holin
VDIIKRAATTGGGDWTPRLADVWAVVTACVGAILVALGGFDLLLQTFLAAVVFDYLTGVLSALYRGELSSSVGAKGIIRKLGLVTAVAFANYLDCSGLFGDGHLVRNLFCVAFIVSEATSILENLHEIGVPVPAWLISRLAVFRKTIEEGKWPPGPAGTTGAGVTP